MLSIALAGAIGALALHLAAPSLDGWLTGALGAVALVSTVLWVVDGTRMRRLAGWLAAGTPGPAPPLGGPLGDIAYRIERAFGERVRELEEERGRLAQFLSAIDASPNGVVLLDDHDQVEWFNGTAAQHFGLDAARDHRQRVTNLVRAPAFVAHLQRGRFEGEVVFPSPRGDATLAVIVRRYGERNRVVISQDITERERNDVMRRDFVANVSHEIRSPLTALAGFVESLASLRLTDAERQRVLHLMRQQTERMQSLVTDLLALAQIEGAPTPPADRWVDVAALHARLEADARSLDRDRHPLEFRRGAVARIAGVESELYSACWNLISNALRYTPAGGRVDVEWKPRADGGAEFAVRDEGPGIAREHLPRLTERFYRVDPSRSRETGGTGLGLAIVKHVVQRHGGELVVSSEPGRGSLFRIALPAHRVQREQPAAITPA